MGKCKLNNSWFTNKDGNGYTVSQWAERHSDMAVFCRLCACSINVENKGFHAILQHSVGNKHKNRCREILCGKQLVLERKPTLSTLENNSESSSTSSMTEQKKNLSTLRLYSVKEQATVAELLWTMKSVCSNFSFNSCTNIEAIFEAMFPGGVPEGFSLCPQKMHYIITDALAVYFHDEMLKDLGSSPFSICFDETTNATDRKELQITVSYWSDMKSQVVHRHLETIFTGKADAVTLHTLIKKAINEANLSLSQLTMLGSDGPKVNIKVFNLFNEEVLALRSKRLLDIGTCPIHIVHNAFLKSVETFGEDAMNLVISVYHYFNGWPSRWEEYEIVQEKLKLEPHKFLKHTPTRWLSFIDSGARLIEQWTGLKYYFLKYIPQHKKDVVLQRQSVKKIVDFLKKPDMLAQLHFTISSAKLYQRFTKQFQNDAPLIHILYTELQEVIRTIAGRICKTVVQDAKGMKYIIENTKSPSYDWVDCKLFDVKHLLPLTTIVLSEELQSELSSLSELDVKVFLKNVQLHYIAGAKHIIEKSIIKSSNLKQALGFLNPKERKLDITCKYIETVSKSLPIDVPLDELVDEWKCLQTEKEPEKDVLNSKRIDDYWAYFMKLNKENNSPKFPLVTQVIKAALTLSHGNADIERRFSTSKNVLTEEKTQMSCRTLNSILIIRDALRAYNNKPNLVPITKKMITMGQNAHKHYQNYLQTEREAKEKEKKIKEEERKLKQLEKERLEKAKTVKRSIEEIENKLAAKKKKIKDAKESADTLLNEASDRLKKALKKGDLKEAHLAQGMLEGVISLKDEESKEEKHIVTLEKTVEKKKNALITSFFTKDQNSQSKSKK